MGESSRPTGTGGNPLIPAGSGGRPEDTCIELKRAGRLTLIRPFFHELTRCLQFRFNPSEMEKGSLQSKTHVEKMWGDAPGAPGWKIFPAGMTYRICCYLERAGYKYTYEDIRGVELKPDFAQWQDPDWTLQPREWQQKAIAFTLSSPGGLIHTATATGKTKLIQLLAQCLPESRIVIASGQTNALHSTYKVLKPVHPKEVAGLGVVGREGDPRRITICHYKSLPMADLDEADIVMFDEVHGAGAEWTRKQLSKASYANMYGFSANVSGRSDQAEPAIEALFGPVIYRIPHEEAVEAGLVSPVTVDMWHIKGRPIYGKSTIDHERRGIVRNTKRNDAWAKILRNNYADRSVLVFCRNNLEHIFRMRRRLPDYVPVYANMSSKMENRIKDYGLWPTGYTKLLGGEHFEIAEAMRQGEVTKVLATSVWEAGVDLPALQTVARMDAVNGEIPATQKTGRATRPDSEGRVVDSYDDFGQRMMNGSRKRVRHYEKLGYTVRKIGEPNDILPEREEEKR